MDTCRLCGTAQEKFQKSHIIPDFMYRDLKNSQSQILRMRMPFGKRLRHIPTGFYEKPLLCTSCEKMIGAWESYAEKMLTRNNHFEVPKDKTAGELIRLVEDVEYKRFKLFLLSIVWRASVSNLPFFSEVFLGKEHEGRIGQMLLKDDPGEEDDYPVTLIVPEGPAGKNLSIGQPYKNKNAANAVRYLFPICEVIYLFHISKHGQDDANKLTAIKKDNTMKVVFWPTSRLNAFLELYQVRKAIRMRQRGVFLDRRR